MHYVELDQFIGDRFLVTTHGPLNPKADPAAALVEVDSRARSVETGKAPSQHGFELSHALLSALAGRMRMFTAELTTDVWGLEQRVTAGHLGDPEEFLDEMFRARHGLLTVKTMSTLSREVYGRMVTVEAFGPGEGRKLIKDAVDEFHHLAVMADGQKDYLQGTIEFYQARTNTKMTVAAERLAVIAAITLPVTALSSVLGMNVIVNAPRHTGGRLRVAGGHAGDVVRVAGLGQTQGLVLAAVIARFVSRRPAEIPPRPQGSIAHCPAPVPA